MRNVSKAIGWGIVIECGAVSLIFIGFLFGGAPPCGTASSFGSGLMRLGEWLHYPSLMLFPDDSALFLLSAVGQSLIWACLLYFWFNRQDDKRGA